MIQHFRFPIILPENYKVLVKVGDKIHQGQVLAQLESRQSSEINVATALGTSPKEVEKYLQVPVNSQVKKGTVLARRKTMFGTKEVSSPDSGLVHKVSTETGVVSLTVPTGNVQKIDSPVDGEVLSVTGPLEIAVAGRTWEAVEVRGGVGWGPFSPVGQWGSSKLEELNIEHSGKIVATADIISGAWISKAAALEVAGIVCAALDSSATVDVKIPFAALGADSNGQIDRHLWENLVTCEGKIALIDPKTKILGVVEP